jgi:hypothetical protein
LISSFSSSAASSTLGVHVTAMSWICDSISSARGVVALPAVKWPLTRFFRLAALPT